jgi:hypothetical protein
LGHLKLLWVEGKSKGTCSCDFNNLPHVEPLMDFSALANSKASIFVKSTTFLVQVWQNAPSSVGSMSSHFSVQGLAMDNFFMGAVWGDSGKHLHSIQHLE